MDKLSKTFFILPVFYSTDLDIKLTIQFDPPILTLTMFKNVTVHISNLW